MNLKSKNLAKTSAPRVPAVTAADRLSTDEFLEHFEHRILKSIDEHRQLTLTHQTDALVGQIGYWRHAVQCIRWLRAMNRQRRSDV